jgi:hypothetical protein
MTTPPRHAGPAAGSGGRVADRPWSPGSPEAPERMAQRTIASFSSYADVERGGQGMSTSVPLRQPWSWLPAPFGPGRFAASAESRIP